MNQIVRAFIAAIAFELRRELLSRRAIGLAFCFLIPPLAAQPLRRLLGFASVDSYSDYLLGFVLLAYATLLVPLATLVSASTLVRSEVEQGTWHMRLLTPLAVWQTVLAKLIATVAMVATLTLPSVAATAFVFTITAAAEREMATEIAWRAGAALVLAAMAYAALFAFIGLIARKPLTVGIIAFLVLEVGMQNLPGSMVIRQITVMHHLLGVAVPPDFRTKEGVFLTGAAEMPVILESPAAAALRLTILASIYTVIALGLAQFREQNEKPGD